MYNPPDCEGRDAYCQIMLETEVLITQRKTVKKLVLKIEGT